MKQNGFKSRWLTGAVLPCCSGGKQTNTLNRQAPEALKKKKKSLEVVAYRNKDARQKKRKKAL